MNLEISVGDSLSLTDNVDTYFQQRAYSYDYSSSPIEVEIPQVFIEVAYRNSRNIVSNIFIEIAYKGSLGVWQIYEV